MTTKSINEAIERLNSHITNGTLVRHEWTGTDSEGRATACLLAAVFPECGKQKSSEFCPASVMPLWLAIITPEIDDNGSDSEWPTMVRRYAKCMEMWANFDNKNWRRVLCKFMISVVTEAVPYTETDNVKSGCEKVINLFQESIGSGLFDKQKFYATAKSAAAAYAAAYTSHAINAANAATAAAHAAAYASHAINAAAAAVNAAHAAAYAASYAAKSAATANAAVNAAVNAAANAAVNAAAWDRMTVGLFEAIESEHNALVK